jgi:hypothetical protein
MAINELSVQGMLCDFAEVSGGKLFISGAGINLIATASNDGPTYPVNIALALLVRIPWTATNQQHKLKVELLSDTPGGGPKRVAINAGSAPEGSEDDEGTILALFTAGRSPNMQAGEESLMPVALPMPGVPLPDMGSYYFSIFIDGTELDRVSFRVTSIANVMAPFGRVA